MRRVQKKSLLYTWIWVRRKTGVKVKLHNMLVEGQTCHSHGKGVCVMPSISSIPITNSENNLHALPTQPESSSEAHCTQVWSCAVSSIPAFL